MREDSIYKIGILTPEVRIEQILNQSNNSKRFYSFPYFRNTPQDLKVIRVPIELPIYRMSNYRTKTAQQMYIRKNNKPLDFFSNGQENVTAQQVQHKLLYQFAQKGKGDSIIPIKDVLESEAQHEPILITFDGVVVNGNRRLSAMRELYVLGMTNYSHVDCMVLPSDATNSEIQEIEAKLQMSPLTILPYDWICEGYLIKDLLNSGKSKKQVAKIMRRQPAEIDNHLIAVDQAELYLSEWLETPGDYTKVDEEKEQIFMDIARNLKNKTGEDLEASRLIAFILADNSGELGTRVYDYKPAFGTSSTEVINRIAKRHDLCLEQVVDKKDDQLELEFVIDTDSESNNYSIKPVIELLSDRSKSDVLVGDITQIFDSIKSEKDDHAAGQSALKKIKEALTKLMEADISRADTSTHTHIIEQLTSVRQRVDKLEAEVALAKNALEE